MGFACRWSLDPATGMFEQVPQSGKTRLPHRQGAPAPKEYFLRLYHILLEGIIKGE